MQTGCKKNKHCNINNLCSEISWQLHWKIAINILPILTIVDYNFFYEIKINQCKVWRPKDLLFWIQVCQLWTEFINMWSNPWYTHVRKKPITNRRTKTTCGITILSYKTVVLILNWHFKVSYLFFPNNKATSLILRRHQQHHTWLTRSAI